MLTRAAAAAIPLATGVRLAAPVSSEAAVAAPVAAEAVANLNIPSSARLGGQLVAISRQYKDRCFYREQTYASQTGTIEQILVPADDAGYTGFFVGDWIRQAHTGELWEIMERKERNSDGQVPYICKAIGATEDDYSIPNAHSRHLGL